MVPLFCQGDTHVTHVDVYDDSDAARRAAYQVSSEGLRQDHFLLQLLLNVLCRVNHPLAEERQTERRVEDGKKEQKYRQEVNVGVFLISSLNSSDI